MEVILWQCWLDVYDGLQVPVIIGLGFFPCIRVDVELRVLECLDARLTAHMLLFLEGGYRFVRHD